MKRGYGICPGTCGELVQGLIGKNEYISSYCVDVYSRAMIHEKKNTDNRILRRKTKSISAISSVFQKFGYPKKMLENIDLVIKSNIPVGKGMASSTADIGASIMAALDFIGESMSLEEISVLAASIEATDSIYYKDVCIFDPINGTKKKSLGFLNCKKVLILEPNNRINTMNIRKDVGYYKILKKNRSITEKSFELLEKGIKNSDMDLVKRACLNSAFANESIKKTPFLNEIVDISEKNNCGFVNISHTGTVIGISIGDDTDIDRLKYDLDIGDLGVHYDRKYVRNIISAGIRKEGFRDGLYKKSK